MKVTRFRLLTWATVLLLGYAQQSQAQAFVSREIERQLQPGSSIPFGGANYAEWYHYGAGVNYFYPGYRRGQFQYLEYLDRLDRAEKFGYRRPSLPRGLPRSWGPSHPRVFIRIMPVYP